MDGELMDDPSTEPVCPCLLRSLASGGTQTDEVGTEDSECQVTHMIEVS